MQFASSGSQTLSAVTLSVAIALLSGCSRSYASGNVSVLTLSPNVKCATSDCKSYNVVPYVLSRSQYGTACLGNVPPGTTVDPERPPQSYLATDIGRAGFPRLSTAELHTVRSIARYIRSKTLRVAWVDHASTHRNFIVFDADQGPCFAAPGGYVVLNGTCNEFYEPGENPYHTLSAPSCVPMKRPWSHDLR